jgi:hypothetical protein
VYIDEKLNWNDHIHNVCTKVSRGIGIISRLKYIFPHYILISLYYSLVYPYLYYCCIIWGSAYSNVLNTVEVLQNRVARVITSAPYRSSARPILKQLNLLHLPDIYIFQVLTFMYKVRFNILPQPCLSYFTLNKTSNYNMRNTSYFKLLPYRTNVKQKTISIAGPKLWNTIPTELQDSRNPHQFKSALKSWLIDQYV